MVCRLVEQEQVAAAAQDQARQGHEAGVLAQGAQLLDALHRQVGMGTGLDAEGVEGAQGNVVADRK